MALLTMRKMAMALLASIMLPLSVNADDVVTIKIFGNDGKAKEYALDDINRLAFDTESFTMIFNTNVADETFRYEDVLKMSFGSNSSTSIQNVAEENDVRISYDGNILTVEGVKAAQLCIYDISGRPVINKFVKEREQIRTEQLSSGVYILKINNKTFKFSKL